MRRNTDMGSVDRGGSRTSPLMLSNHATGKVSFDNWIKVDEFGNLITSVIVETLYDIAVVSDDDLSDEMLYADAQDFTQDDASSSHEPATLLPGNEEHQTHVGFDTAFMPVRNGTIDVIREFSLYLEEGTEKSALGIAITRFNYTLTTGTQFQQAVSESSGGGIYFYYKRYLNQRGVFASPYLLGGIGGGNLNWRYRQGIIDSDGYLIDSDSLGFTDLRFGVGSELGRPYSVSLTLSATAIWRIYNATTEEGFDNDVLPDHYVPAFGSSLSIKF